ncbi:CCA tRNA nucleotidyltransferase [Sedimentitalea todarodis]|uniref:CCA tRNA nucleotidyltransferase n=1 Tax=Sedimentitalea todarodis TaxID=1631240 RepID=A0ABU3VDJ3_9RHOB|nr:CCA tRNA nucleotidyltransferase [Sedimentitalea todarodis]MDU9004249.1 CCA tRNA nucleotidyltransferase [Sedimentitalea todarodis]
MTRLTADWISNASTRVVCDALGRDGAQVLFVGGCVRNTLLYVDVSDIDIATDATPDQVMALAKAAGIKVVPTGIDHGTLTLLKDGLPHEVTTFRRDVSTDGRRATVAFSTDVAEDAARRDFTMNAIYARSDGTVVDPLHGLPDLRARRVRFIGNAEERIREDYLRSLRYFRFHAWYGDQNAGFDSDALAAIAANLEGLGRLSRERIGSEMQKLLAAPDPAPSVAAMRTTGALAWFVPGADDRALAPLAHVESLAGARPNAIRRLAVLGGTETADALRLSRAGSASLDRLRNAAFATTDAAELGYRLGASDARDALLIRCAVLEQPWVAELEDQVTQGAVAQFPVRAKDLMPRFQGPELGAELARLEALWIGSGFDLDRDVLLTL